MLKGASPKGRRSAPPKLAKVPLRASMATLQSSPPPRRAALILVCETEVVERFWVIRLDSDRLVEHFNGAFKVTLLTGKHTKQVKAIGMTRIR